LRCDALIVRGDAVDDRVAVGDGVREGVAVADGSVEGDHVGLWESVAENVVERSELGVSSDNVGDSVGVLLRSMELDTFETEGVNVSEPTSVREIVADAESSIVLLLVPEVENVCDAAEAEGSPDSVFVTVGSDRELDGVRETDVEFEIVAPRPDPVVVALLESDTECVSDASLEALCVTLKDIDTSLVSDLTLTDHDSEAFEERVCV
jgi:hypothetical protein